MVKSKSIKKAGKTTKKKAGSTQALSPFDEMEGKFASMFHRGGLFPLRDGLHLFENWSPFEGKMPSVDMIDHKDKVLIKVELPGVDKKDVDVSVSDHAVTIKGKTSTDEEEEKGDYYRREITSGTFERVLAIPGNIDSSKVKARFRNGVLKVALPKSKTDKTNNTKVTVR